MKSDIKLFDEKKVRTVWNEEQEKWYFSVVDVVEVLTDSPRPRKYWNALKTKLQTEGSELSQNMGQLKILSPDGKMRLTDVADTEQIFRLIQSIPSKKAEPFKLWLAKVGTERIDETFDPELSIDRAIHNYRRLGYSENWINQRIKRTGCKRRRKSRQSCPRTNRKEYRQTGSFIAECEIGNDAWERKKYGIGGESEFI